MNVVEKISQVFPDWEVEGIIGKGSFGEVYKVTKEEYGQQNISAVKVISIPRTREEVEELKMQGMDDMSVSTYYQAVFNDLVNEIQVMSSLKGNTNIVSIEDYKIEEKKPFGWNIYIRMEYLTDLKTYLKRHPMTEKDIVRLGMDISSALEYCEKASIVHRDIKPANIFVSPYGDFKLGDFGIAKSIERTTSVAMSQKGTKPFMAPELIRGESGIKANQVDIYSLGIVLYCCLNNNRYPFMPKYPKAISYSDTEEALIRRINGERIEEPQFGSKNLKEIVLCACSGDRLYRFMSAAAMKSALSQIYSTSNGTEIILDINNPVLPVENNDSPISQPGLGGKNYSQNKVKQDYTPNYYSSDTEVFHKRSLVMSKSHIILIVLAAVFCITGIAGIVLLANSLMTDNKEENHSPKQIEDAELTEINFFDYFVVPPVKGYNGCGTIPEFVKPSEDCPVDGLIYTADTYIELSNDDTVRYYLTAEDESDISDYLASSGYKCEVVSTEITIGGLSGIASIISKEDAELCNASVLSYIRKYQVNYSDSDQLYGIKPVKYIYLSSTDSNKFYIVYEITVNETRLALWNYYFYLSLDLDDNNAIISDKVCISNLTENSNEEDYNVPVAFDWSENSPVVANNHNYVEGVNHYYVGYYSVEDMMSSISETYPEAKLVAEDILSKN